MNEGSANDAAEVPGAEAVLGALVEQVLYATGPTAATGANPDNVRALLGKLLDQLGNIVPQLMGNLQGEGAHAHPYWGFVARDRSGEQQVCLVPKDSGQLHTLQEKLFFATIFALVHEPGVLAWLATHGVHIQFVEQRSLPSTGPKLII